MAKRSRKMLVTQLPTGACVRFDTASKKVSPAVLMVHGWQSNIFRGIYAEVAELLTILGYHVMRLSLRGHEGAQGLTDKVTRASHLKDIEAAYKFLKKRPEVDSKWIGGFGTSYGAYLLSAASPKLSLQALGLRAPALYPDRDWREPILDIIEDKNLSAWRQTVQENSDNSALKGIGTFTGDLFIIASGLDEQMPPAVLASYEKAAAHVHSLTTVVLPTASHVLDQESKEEFLKITKKWFQDIYPSSSVS